MGGTMILKIGDKVIYRGQEYLIANIKQEETLDGIGILMQAVDAQTLYNEQEKRRTAEQVQHDMMEMVKKFMEGGGTLGGIGFPFPGGPGPAPRGD